MTFLLDATKITKYNCNSDELELMILFWICAAGKNGVTATRCLNNLLSTIYNDFKNSSPFSLLKWADKNKDLPQLLKGAGIGCYNNKAKSFRELIYSNINLRTCDISELELISGIGPKTSRCFILHSRPNQKVACLDTHILKWLRDQGIDAPKSTPTGKKYLILEKKFLEIAATTKKDVAALDLEIWNLYRSA